MSNNILKINYVDEMKKSYIDYAMNVVIDRAIPDVRDGLKPVHRRILYAMNELNLTFDKPHRKSARIVGDVLGKFHPHGDASVYEAMVRMAQDFSMRITLIDGHGNFGSIDGDPPASMRYTEVRLTKEASEMLQDLEKDIVDFKDNFDGTIKEPVVLPSKIPNLLVNGAIGIAVGMQTYIPQHNLGETIDAIIAYLDNENIEVEEILNYIKGPDFPTGGVIINKSELIDLYKTGTGRIKVKGKIQIEDGDYGRKNIVITEIPYTYAGNKMKLLEEIVDLIKNKKIDDIVDVRDESNKEGIRIVVEVKKGANINNVVNGLYKKTGLESVINANFLVLVNNKPSVLNIKEIIKEYVDFQKEINIRKFKYLLAKNLEKKEILEGLIKARDIIDLIIEILRGSKTVQMAKDCLMYGKTEGIDFKTKKSEKEASKLCFTERQAEAILDMKLQKLIGLEFEKLFNEITEITKEIEKCEKILNSEKELKKYIKQYLKEIKNKYATPRKTEIIDEVIEEYKEEFKEEDLYLLIDRFGYVKTVDTSSIIRANEDTLKDYKVNILTKNIDKLCIFDEEGNMHTIKVLEIPKLKMKEKGVLIDTLVKTEKLHPLLYISYTELMNSKLLFITKSGLVKIVDGKEFDTSRSMIKATKLEDNDKLVCVKVLKEEKEILILTNNEYILRFNIEEIPELKKMSKGVKGIQLIDNDYIKNVILLDGNKEEMADLLISLENIKIKKRGSKGMKI